MATKPTAKTTKSAATKPVETTTAYRYTGKAQLSFAVSGLGRVTIAPGERIPSAWFDAVPTESGSLFEPAGD